MKFGKKRGAEAKGAGQGGKRPRSSGRAASSPDHGQPIGLMAPAAADSRPPTASLPHKLPRPAGVIDITGGDVSPAGPSSRLEELPLSEVRIH